MVSSAILAFAVIFLICFCAPASLYSVFPEVLSLGVLLAGFLWGARGLAVLLPACWSVLSAGWIIEDRLADQLHGHDIGLTGVVCDVPGNDGHVQRFPFVIDVDQSVPGISRRIYVSWYDAETRVRAGERWRLTLRLKRPRGTSNPAGFDFERWAFMRDIGATGYVRDSAKNLRLSSAGGRCELASFRHRIAAEIVGLIPEGSSVGHILALAVGVRNRLSDKDWNVLRRTGTAHLMAISGLHIGLAAGFAFFCFHLAGRGLLLVKVDCRPLVFARVGALSGAVAYSALAGFAMPTVRAVVMTSAVILLTGLRRTIPVSAVLSIALYVVLWVSPFAMLAAGFWLSFGAVFVLLVAAFGIRSPGVIGADPRSRLTDAFRTFRLILRAQLCLSIGLMPASAYFFGQVSLAAPLANLLVVPLFAILIVPLLIIGVIMLVMSPVTAAPVFRLVDWMLTKVIQLLESLNQWVPVAVDVPEVHVFTVGGCIVAALILIWPSPLPGRFRTIVLLFISMTISGIGMRYVTPRLRVVVMDVGQGLSVLLQTPGYALLFDAGPGYRRGDAGRSIVIPMLRHYGVKRLDRLVVSHGDSDHAGGARSVLDAFPDAELVSSVRLDMTARGFHKCRAGQHWQKNGVSFRFLHPGMETDFGAWSKNDTSCVLLVQTAEFGLLLPGDIEKRAENLLVSSGTLPEVDVVIASHHGSRTSSVHPFIVTTRPDYVVFSAGFRNQWRFPASDVRERWSAIDACTLTTGHTGALVFEAHGTDSLRLVKKYRLDEARIWTETGSDGLAPDRCRAVTSVN